MIVLNADNSDIWQARLRDGVSDVEFRVEDSYNLLVPSRLIRMATPTRVLEDGGHYRVLKNFPTSQDLLQGIEGVSTKSRYQELEHYWTFQFETM